MDSETARENYITRYVGSKGSADPDTARERYKARTMNYDADDDDRDDRPAETHKGGGGNNRIAYGLCEEFGIKLPKNAPPRQAWEALEGKGVNMHEVFESVRKTGSTKEYVDKFKKQADNGKAKTTDNPVKPADDKPTGTTPSDVQNSGSTDEKSSTTKDTTAKPKRPKCEATTLKGVAEYQEKELGVKCALKKTTDVRVANIITNSISDAFDYAPKIKSVVKTCGTLNTARTQIKEDLSAAYAHYYRRQYPWLDNAAIQYKVVQSIKIPCSGNAVACFMNLNNQVPWQFDATETQLFAGPAYKWSGIYTVGNNGTDLDKMNEETAYGVATGYHPQGCEDVKSVVDHEIGHAIDAAYGLLENKEIKQYLKDHMKDIKSGLSEYAAEQETTKLVMQEAIAEAWTEYINNPNPRQIASDLGKMIEGVINNDKG